MKGVTITDVLRAHDADTALTFVELTWHKQRIENRIRFGQPAAQQILDRHRRVVSFAPGSIFCFVRWVANEYGTILSRADVIRAVAAGERYQTLPFVRPGGDILLRMDGWPKVERVLHVIDAVEALGIDPADAAPDYRDTLERVFKQAKRWGWSTSNPFEHVNPIGRIKDERDRFLSDSERKALLKCCQESGNDLLYPIVVFALSTGARKREILDLTLDDLDLKRGVAVLRDTKNGETRTVPVVHHLHDLMKKQVAKVTAFYEEQDAPKHGRWLFPRPDGVAPIDIRAPWEKALEVAKIKNFRFHDLRHSTASYLAMNGASVVEIADVLGHKTLQMVKRYAHLSESHVKTVVESLNKSLF